MAECSGNFVIAVLKEIGFHLYFNLLGLSVLPAYKPSPNRCGEAEVKAIQLLLG